MLDDAEHSDNRYLQIDINEIPPLQTATMKIMNLIFDEEVDIDELVNAIKHDVNLSTKVMMAANSPVYRTQEPLDSLSRAIVNLGLDTLKKIILSVSVIGAIEQLITSKSFQIILSHSLATATAAQLLAEKLAICKPDFAFLNGLFVNLGLFGIASTLSQEFESLYAESRQQSIHFKSIIENKVNVDIGELGLNIAHNWGLPNSILENLEACQAVQQNTNTDAEPSLGTILYLASMAADVYFDTTTIVNIEKFKAATQAYLGQTEEGALDILQMISAEFNDFSDALSLNLPKQSSYTEMLKKANQELIKISDKYEQMYRSLSAKNEQMQLLSQDLEKKNTVLNKLVTTDSLTMIYNRRFFEKALDRAYHEHKRYKKSFSIVMLDIDHFKQVNDQYGHKAGDEVLVATAKAIRNNLRKCDICARYGGEEFIIILPETSFDGAHAIAEKIRQIIAGNQISLSTIHSESTLNITASLGVMELTDNIDSTSKLIIECDKYLYLAKEEGRNTTRPHKRPD